VVAARGHATHQVRRQPRHPLGSGTPTQSRSHMLRTLGNTPPAYVAPTGQSCAATASSSSWQRDDDGSSASASLVVRQAALYVDCPLNVAPQSSSTTILEGMAVGAADATQGRHEGSSRGEDGREDAADDEVGTPSLNALKMHAPSLDYKRRRGLSRETLGDQGELRPWTYLETLSERGALRPSLERAVRADPTLTALDLSSRADFRALSSPHKAQAIRMLSTAALTGGLEQVHLDSLELDLACAEAIATLLSAPRLRVLTLTANKLDQAAMQCIARGLHKHPSLTTLALSDQQCGAISTSATEELLDAMETVPTLTKLRLGTVHNVALRRRYLTLESERAAPEVEASNVALFGSIGRDTSSPPAMRSSNAPAVSHSPGQQRLYRKVPSAYSPPLAIGGAGESTARNNKAGTQLAVLVGRAELAARPTGGRLHRGARAASCTDLHHPGGHRGGTLAVQPLPSTYRGLTPVSAFHSPDQPSRGLTPVSAFHSPDRPSRGLTPVSAFHSPDRPSRGLTPVSAFHSPDQPSRGLTPVSAFHSPDRPSTFGPSFGHAPGHGSSGRLAARGVTPTRPNSPGTVKEASADSPWPSFHPPLLDEPSAGGWPGAWATAWPRGGDDMGGATSRGSSPYPSTPLSCGNSRPHLASDQM